MPVIMGWVQIVVVWKLQIFGMIPNAVFWKNDVSSLVLCSSFSELTEGTRLPVFIIAWQALPNSEPDATSALKRSPDEMCV